MSDRGQDDRRLRRAADAAQRGDPSARAELLDGLQDAVFRFCLMQLGDRELSRDATQETGLRILQSVTSFRGTSQVRTWALGIALNVCRELRRQRERHRSDDFDESWDSKQTSPEACVDQQEDITRLTRSMRLLTDRQREAVTLRYFEEMSIAETAEAMQVATGTVKATVAQAIERLKVHWSQSHEQSGTRVG